MIFGECPYEDCEEPFTTFMADNSPQFEKIKCEKCGRFFMELHSRIQPQGFTMDDFNKEYEINEETRQIKKKDAPNTKEASSTCAQQLNGLIPELEEDVRLLLLDYLDKGDAVKCAKDINAVLAVLKPVE